MNSEIYIIKNKIQVFLVPGTYLIYGLGEVVITANLLILLGEVDVDIWTEIYNKVEKWLKIHFVEQVEEAQNDIPKKLKNDKGNVDLSKFDQKVKGRNAKKEE